MKIAVIGCGTIARSAHIPAYLQNPTAELAYFYDASPARAEEAAALAGQGVAVPDVDTILRDPSVEAVSICTPNHTHAALSIAAMRAGKHVLCEKPVACRYEDALAMLRVKRETGRVLQIGVVNRFNDSVRRIRDYIQSGRLGEVYHVYLSFRAHRSIPGLGGAFTTKALAGGGVLLDWGVHYLDLAMYCLGDPAPLRVSGEVFSRLGRDIPAYAYTEMWAGPPKPDGVYDVEDSVTALVRTTGATITLHGAWAQNIGVDETYIDFMGDRAGIRLRYGEGFTLYGAENGALTATTPQFISADMYHREINEFLQAVQTHTEPCASIDSVILTARVMQAIYDSAEAHREVACGEDEDEGGDGDAGALPQTPAEG